jgi:hypothetical protein
MKDVGFIISGLMLALQKGSLWARFGTIECIIAPRRRSARLVAVGLDRLVVPDVTP